MESGLYMSKSLIDLEPIEIIKQLENDRSLMGELIKECHTRGIKKAEAEEAYRREYSKALFYLKNGEVKYPSTLLTELAKGKVSKFLEAKEKTDIEYELIREKLRNVRIDIEILRTFLSYSKEQMKMI